jgi:hypothetical protein
MIVEEEDGTINIVYSSDDNASSASERSEDPVSALGEFIDQLFGCEKGTQMSMKLRRWSQYISMKREHLDRLRRCKGQDNFPQAIIWTGGKGSECATLISNCSQRWLKQKRKDRIVQLLKEYFPKHFDKIDVPIITLSMDELRNLWAFNEITNLNFDRNKNPCLEETLGMAVKRMGDPEDVKVMLPDFFIICNGGFIPFGNGFSIDPKWDGFIAETLKSLSESSFKGTFGVQVLHFGPNMIPMPEQFRPVFCPECPGCDKVSDWIGQNQHLEAISYLEQVRKLIQPA